jgi:outer membrane protein TolC
MAMATVFTFEKYGRGRRSATMLALIYGFSLFSAVSGATPKRLSLAEAVSRARANPLVRAASEQHRAAEARLSEARGARFLRAEILSFIAPSPDIRCLDQNCTRTDPRDPRLAADGVFGGVRVGVVQPLYTFGKIDAAIDAAGSAARASDALAAGVKADLALETTRSYFGVGLARELVSMLEEGEQQIAKGKQTLVERLERGDPDVTVQDRLRLDTFQAEVALRLSEAREGEALALLALRTLVGDAEADTDRAPLEPLTFTLGDARGYVERARMERPELRAAREGVAALEGASRLEQARWLPDFMLVGGFNVARAQGVDQSPSAFANDPFNNTTGEVALVMKWSLDPGGQIARVERADSELGRARALLDAAGRAGGAAVLQAHTHAVEARVRLASAREGEKNARGWVASVIQADAIGTTSAQDLADAYLAYFTLHARMLQSTYDWNVAIMTLKRSIGESPSAPARP